MRSLDINFKMRNGRRTHSQINENDSCMYRIHRARLGSRALWMSSLDKKNTVERNKKCPFCAFCFMRTQISVSVTCSFLTYTHIFRWYYQRWSRSYFAYGNRLTLYNYYYQRYAIYCVLLCDSFFAYFASLFFNCLLYWLIRLGPVRTLCMCWAITTMPYIVRMCVTMSRLHSRNKML